jgi:hypothetical protein
MFTKMLGPQSVKLRPKVLFVWLVVLGPLVYEIELLRQRQGRDVLVVHPLIQIADPQQRTGAIDDATHGRQIGTLLAAIRQDGFGNGDQGLSTLGFGVAPSPAVLVGSLLISSLSICPLCQAG